MGTLPLFVRFRQWLALDALLPLLYFVLGEKPLFCDMAQECQLDALLHLHRAVVENESRTTVVKVDAPYIYLRSVLWASGNVSDALKSLCDSQTLGTGVAK